MLNISFNRYHLQREENGNWKCQPTHSELHGKDGYIKKGGLVEGWLGRTITVEIEGKKYTLNKGSLIDFLKAKGPSESNKLLDKSWFCGSPNQLILKIFNEYTKPKALTPAPTSTPTTKMSAIPGDPARGCADRSDPSKSAVKQEPPQTIPQMPSNTLPLNHTPRASAKLQTLLEYTKTQLKQLEDQQIGYAFTSSPNQQQKQLTLTFNDNVARQKFISARYHGKHLKKFQTARPNFLVLTQMEASILLGLQNAKKEDFSKVYDDLQKQKNHSKTKKSEGTLDPNEHKPFWEKVESVANSKKQWVQVVKNDKGQLCVDIVFAHSSDAVEYTNQGATIISNQPIRIRLSLEQASLAFQRSPSQLELAMQARLNTYTAQDQIPQERNQEWQGCVSTYQEGYYAPNDLQRFTTGDNLINRAAAVTDPQNELRLEFGEALKYFKYSIPHLYQIPRDATNLIKKGAILNHKFGVLQAPLVLGRPDSYDAAWQSDTSQGEVKILVHHVAAMNVGESHRGHSEDYRDYVKGNVFDEDTYIKDMGFLFQETLRTQRDNGVTDSVSIPLGMGAFLRHLAKHKGAENYTEGSHEMTRLRLRIAKEMIQAAETSGIILHFCQIRDETNLEVKSNYTAFSQAVRELKPTNFKVHINVDALDLCKKLGKEKDPYKVGLINGANRNKLGNAYDTHNARFAVDENLHRRSYLLCLFARCINTKKQSEGTSFNVGDFMGGLTTS